MTVPGWPSIDDEVIVMPDPNPYPTNISEFERAIQRWSGACEDARGQIMRIRDCQKTEARRIAEGRQYIRRLQKLIAKCKADIARKQAKDRPEQEIEQLRHHIETALANIENTEAEIEESEAALQRCNQALIDAWTSELRRRYDILRKLRRERKQGISSRTGETRRCRALNATGGRCQNEMEFVDGKWGPCVHHR